jgi:hypothetical protein
MNTAIAMITHNSPDAGFTKLGKKNPVNKKAASTSLTAPTK